MQSKNNKKSFTTIKKRFLIYLLIIILGVSSIFIISIYAGEILKTNAKVINILGKQRMLTQSLSKNSNRLYVINQELNSEMPIQTDEILRQKLLIIKRTLLEDANSYQSVYENLITGTIALEDQLIKIPKRLLKEIEPELNSIIDIWSTFDQSIQDVIEFNYESFEFKDALVYINENNEALLLHSDSMFQVFEDHMIHQYEIYRNLTYLLMGFVIILTSFLMYQMYSDLFKALNVFYRHIDNLGLEHDHSHSLNQGNAIADEVESMFVGFTETLELTEKINTYDSFTDTLHYIYKSFNHFLPYSYIGIALLKNSNPTKVIASYGISEHAHQGLSEALLGYEVLLSETSLEQIMILKEPRIINDFEAYFLDRPIKKYSQILLDHGVKASITLPLKANGKPLGFIFFSSDHLNVYQKKHIEYLKIISNSIALSFQKNIFVDDLVYSSVLALAKLSEARDEDTGEHLVRMSSYVNIIAKTLKENPKYKEILTTAYITDLVKFSPMHDIGKVGIPDYILLKPGKLTKEEFEIMKTHTIYGANVLIEAEENVKNKGRSLFAMGIDIAQNHHEKYDGSGYPAGISGEKIPLCARIVTVADVFDALLSKRPYKEPFSLEETLKIIRDGRDKHFDPDIVDALFESLEDLIVVKNKFDQVHS
ncbi:HD domain-containing phosphohydrolase [Fusibacter sp. 3D3]|uniref:HD domain-containing phosphohydrolase n=1 Tax=Fusibacter sp. 3D3 TaxID=1048380 RepID=UPI000852BC3D|nr:HD domain-containing phosphohydrolase [Fusibacter sp. 3D3]GAU76815.1 response regulator [Fusibacter sp. 3D3]